MKLRFGSLLIVIALAGGLFLFIREGEHSQIPVPSPVSYSEILRNETATTPGTTTQKTIKKPLTVVATTTESDVPEQPQLPQAINLKVPFRSQAPFGDWSEPYENGCEEASLIMVDYYYRSAPLSAQAMKDAIDEQVSWQITNWGSHDDISMEKLVELAKAFYPYQTRILTPLTPALIYEELVLGHPVIVPAAGRELHNPNFRQPGPLYHMLVIKGFTSDGKFITNDPGTRNGADYLYTESTLMSAIHDWTGAAPDGPTVGVVLIPL